MAKRKFSTERLYKLTRNTFFIISALCLLASLISFVVFIIYKIELSNINSSVAYPSQYKERTFESLDDFLNFITYQPTEEDIQFESELVSIGIMTDEEAKRTNELREELSNIFTPPDGFQSAHQLKKHIASLRNKVDSSSMAIIAFMLNAVLAQLFFWVFIMGSIKGVGWLFKYLFPVKDE